jgi:hypothetical protein
MVRRLGRAGLVIVLTASAACAANPAPGQRGYPFNLDGTYTGRVFFAGDPFDATLELDTRGGGTVEGTFRIRQPVPIRGSVDGVIVDNLLRVSIAYGSPGGCAGFMEGVLNIERGGDVFEGPVTVRDCGEPIAGRLAFQRSGEGPAEGGGDHAERAGRAICP